MQIKVGVGARCEAQIKVGVGARGEAQIKVGARGEAWIGFAARVSVKVRVRYVLSTRARSS